MAISHCYWNLVVKNGNFTLLLTSSGQEWQFHIATDIQWSRMAISHCYWHPMVKNGNFTLLLRSSVKNGNFTVLLRSSGQEWQFHIATDIQWSRMAISHCYWHPVVKNGNFNSATEHPVVKNGNFTLLLTSLLSRMAILHCYWYLVVNNGNFDSATDI